MRQIRIHGLQRALLGIVCAGLLAGGSPTARAADIAVEGEAFVRAQKFLVNAGKVQVQPMAGFGKGWSGDAQLFWSGGATGAVIDLLVDVRESGRYNVELHLTRAPDYARLKAEVEGQASQVSPDPYAASVLPPAPWQLGTFTLRSGTRKLSLMIIGKHPQSKGYYVGIDRVRLVSTAPQKSGRAR
jgi:hypothetical protein